MKRLSKWSQQLRSLLFDGSFYTWTVVIGITRLPLCLLPRRYTVRVAYSWATVSLWLMKRILKLTYIVEGPLPKGPCLIAAQHQSAWETIALNTILHDPVFVLKKSLMRIPLYGYFLKRLHMIGIRRGSGRQGITTLIQAVKQRLTQTHPVVIFPEGTRVFHDQRVPYKKGIWHLYHTLNVPVIPLTLDSGLFWGRRASLKYAGCITLTFQEPIKPGLASAEEFLNCLRQRLECP